MILEVAKFFIDAHEHLIEAVKRVVLSVADERSLLFLSDEADVLPDVSFGLSFGEIFAFVVVGGCGEGIVFSFFVEAGYGIEGERFSAYGELGGLLLHSLSLLARVITAEPTKYQYFVRSD